MKNLFKTVLLTGAICLMIISTPVLSQSKKSKQKTDVAEKKEEKKDEDIKLIDDVVKKYKRYDGLFVMYQDTLSGKLFLQVSHNQLSKEYIHFSQIADAPPDSWLFRGAYGWGKIFTISKHFNKIEIALENTAYYFDPQNPLSRAATANINRPVIFSEKIAGISKDRKQYLVEVDKLFLTEAFEQIKPSPNPSEKPGQSFKLGNLSKDKSKVLAIRNYPNNTDVEAELIYEDSYPMNYGNWYSLTDPRYVSIKIRTSLLEVPVNDFKPRFDDPRVGYFTDEITDQTSTKLTPYRDPIHRWHLKKKDPTAALSEPVEPIVWWIENTTPLEVRPLVREGLLMWNKAFEKAGFKNAIVVKQQPDDADWDAGDIRYNVIRWTSSPQVPFYGYGPSFANPRTGQLLGADIMLEYAAIRGFTNESKFFESAAMGLFDDEDFKIHKNRCFASKQISRTLALGKHFVMAGDGTAADEKKLFDQAVIWLTLHEVGHTLGLNHNMKSSNLHDPVKIHDETLTRSMGLTGSVMEYPNVNVALNKEKQGLYYGVSPGTYDLWAIEYGYSEFKDNEAQKLNEILSRSTDHTLLFGNDADVMWAGGLGIDPRVLSDDMSSEPVLYAVDRINLVNKSFTKITEKFTKQGESYQAMRYAYLVLTGEWFSSLRIITRQIGGVHVDRSMVGQSTNKPFVPVDYKRQKDAMRYLAQYGFSPDAFKVSNELYNYLQMQRRGFNLWGTEDPKLHDRFLLIHRDLLGFLLHPSTVQRIIDSELYGNQYKLTEFMGDLTDAIVKNDVQGSVNSMRQNLQIDYVNRLIQIADSKSTYSHVAKANAFAQLNKINLMMAKAGAPDASTKAHREYVVYLIQKFKDTKA